MFPKLEFQEICSMWNGTWLSSHHFPKRTIDSQILLEECSFIVSPLPLGIYHNLHAWLPDAKHEYSSKLDCCEVCCWMVESTDLPPRKVLEEVLWTDSSDPKTKQSLATQSWWFCTCRWLSVESPEGWGPLDITDQTLPRDVQCICFPRLTVWDMRHIHVTTPAGPRPWAKTHVCPDLHKRCWSTCFQSLTAELHRKTCDSSCCKHINHWLMAAMSNLIENLMIHSPFGLK